LWAFPTETLSRSEAGLERAYQQTTLVFHRPMELGPDEAKEISFDFSLCPAFNS
jgi:hypothetical protein